MAWRWRVGETGHDLRPRTAGIRRPRSSRCRLARLRSLFSAPGRPAKRERLSEIFAVEPRTGPEQDDAGEHSQRSETPRVPAYQGSRHRHYPQANQRLSRTVALSTLASATLPRLRESFRQLGIQYQAQPEYRDDHTEEDRDLFETHAVYPCKKKARSLKDQARG